MIIMIPGGDALFVDGSKTQTGERNSIVNPNLSRKWRLSHTAVYLHDNGRFLSFKENLGSTTQIDLIGGERELDRKRLDLYLPKLQDSLISALTDALLKLKSRLFSCL
jgi:hypothetical protein